MSRGDRYEYDTIRDHWRGIRGDRVCNSRLCNIHRDAHRVLGNLHCLYRLVKRFIGETEKTTTAFIIALAIYDGGMGVSVPTFLLGLIVWYASFFASGYADADDIIGL